MQGFYSRIPYLPPVLKPKTSAVPVSGCIALHKDALSRSTLCILGASREYGNPFYRASYRDYIPLSILLTPDKFAHH